MSARTGRRWAWIVLGALALLVVGGLVSFRVAVGALKDRVTNALGPESEITALQVGWSSLDIEGLDALESGLQHQILLTRVLSNDSRTRVFTAHPTAELAQEVNEKLAEFVARQPVSICFLMDRSGKVLASSNYNTEQSFVGNDYSFREYFKDALAGKIGVSLHVGVATSRRGVFIACPVRGDDAIVGVLVTKDELSIFEDRLKDAQVLILLADSNGVILVSNRPQWEGLTIDPIDPEQRAAWQDGRRYGEYSLNW